MRKKILDRCIELISNTSQKDSKNQNGSLTENNFISVNLTAYSLSEMPESKISRKIVEKLVAYILSQKTPGLVVELSSEIER